VVPGRTVIVPGVLPAWVKVMVASTPEPLIPALERTAIWIVPGTFGFAANMAPEAIVPWLTFGLLSKLAS